MVGAGPRGMAAGSAVALSLLVAGCAGAVPPGPARPAAPAVATGTGGSASRVRTTASSAAPTTTTVSDRSGTAFTVTASPVTWSVVVTTNSFLWSAAPGQDFIVDNLTVANPTAQTESLADFDDLTSGLSGDVEFVTASADASALGYSSDCGADAAYPASLCPISYGQGVTVDSDSADHDNRSAVTLAPGASAKITLSYGPVLADVVPTKVSAYFDGGSSPVDLTP